MRADTVADKVKGPPVQPSPLEDDDVRVLKWIGDAPRKCAESPPSCMSFGHMAACRRKLWRAGLVTLDCPPGKVPPVYLLTTAGEKVLEVMAEKERKAKRPVRVKRKTTD